MSEAFDEPIANAVDAHEILGLRRPVTEIAALELIGFVRRELLDRESELAVVLQRLEEIAGDRRAEEGGERPAVGADTPP